MFQCSQYEAEVSQLPERIATALIADADCEAVIEHVESESDSIVSVPRIEDTDGIPIGDHSSVYRIGDGYVIAEGDQETYSEFIAIERSYLPRYLDRSFCGEQKRIVHKAAADVWWLKQ
jgi:hypothetical protein